MRVAGRASPTSSGAATIAPRRRIDVIQEILEKEAILIDRESGRTHRLSKAALAVWHMCDGATTVRHIAASIAQTWDVHLERALDYVAQLIVLFAELNLLERSEGSHGARVWKPAPKVAS